MIPDVVWVSFGGTAVFLGLLGVLLYFVLGTGFPKRKAVTAFLAALGVATAVFPLLLFVLPPGSWALAYVSFVTVGTGIFVYSAIGRKTKDAGRVL
jgi:hypothetical protein